MEKKNHFVRAVSVILAVLMLVTSAPLSGFVGLELPKLNLSAKAYDYTDKGFEYNVYEGKANVLGYYNKNVTSLTIPSTLGGYAVGSIGAYAFEGFTRLGSITIPDSVTGIYEGAFSDTAYYKNSNNWANGVLYIGKHLIEAQKYISGSYTIKSGTRTIANGAFFDCKNLKSISIPNSVVSINMSAFYGCSNLSSVKIPDSVKYIEDEAFSECNRLSSITIGSGVTYIGFAVLFNTSYYNNSSNWSGGVLYVDKYLIEARSNLSGSYSVKSGTQLIANFAFSNCSGLMSVTIPKQTIIGDGAVGFAYDGGGYGAVSGFTIKGTKGSDSEKYAKENGFKFVDVAGSKSPAAVKNLKATQTTSSVTLTWSKSSGAAKYVVYLYNTKTKKYDKKATVTATKATIKNLKAGTSYKFAVVALDKTGKLKSANTVLTTATKPTAPSGLKVTAGKKQATVKWNKVTGATNYTVYFATSKNGAFKALGSTAKNAATVKNLTSSKTYYFKLTANKKVGSVAIKSAYSTVVSVKAK